MAELHALAATAVPGASIAAVASRRRERAEDLAHRLGATACGLDDVPAGAGAVLVVTPPADHVDRALHAVRAGAAVLVEKPLATTLSGADLLVEAEGAGASIAYAENLVHAPAVVDAQDLIAELGPLDHLEVRSIQSRPTWGGFLERAWGGGVLFDLGAHPVALALLAASPARPVSVRASVLAGEGLPVDDAAVVDVSFDSGLTARVEASWRGGEQPIWDLQAASASGVVRLDLLPELRLERDGTEIDLVPPSDGMPRRLVDLGYVPQLATFVDDVARGAAPEVGAAFGRAVLDVICGAYASSGQGDAVPLPFTGPRDKTPLELWQGLAH